MDEGTVEEREGSGDGAGVLGSAAVGFGVLAIPAFVGFAVAGFDVEGLLPALRAANEVVVKARNCEVVAAAATGTVGGSTALMVGFSDEDEPFTLPFGVRMESSKPCLVACWRSALLSCGLATWCVWAGGTGAGSGSLRKELRNGDSLICEAGLVVAVAIDSSAGATLMLPTCLSWVLDLLAFGWVSGISLGTLSFFFLKAVASSRMGELVDEALKSRSTSSFEVLAVRLDVDVFAADLEDPIFFVAVLFAVVASCEGTDSLVFAFDSFAGDFRVRLFFTVVSTSATGSASAASTTFLDLPFFLTVVASAMLSIQMFDPICTGHCECKNVAF